MAEGIFRAEAAKRGLKITAASAGTAAESQVAQNAVTAVSQLEGDITSHRPQQLTPSLAGKYDLILTMTKSHLTSIPESLRSRAHTIHDFARDGKGDVSDPYRAELPVYKKTADELHAAITRILDHLEK